jgi:hypothetical protein
MSTVLGMMMMPVVFGVGGYALVSRRPEINAKTRTGGPSAHRKCLTLRRSFTSCSDAHRPRSAVL